MAKRVTTTIRQSDFWDNDDLVTLRQKRKKHTGRNIGIIVLLLIAGLLIFTVIAINQLKKSAVENSNAQTTTAVKQSPIDLSFSGSGTSPTNEFALPEGNYLVSFSFSTSSSYNISSSEITCVNPFDDQTLPDSVITGSGSASDFISISPSTNCTYDVTTSSGVQWTAKIVNS